MREKDRRELHVEQNLPSGKQNELVHRAYRERYGRQYKYCYQEGDRRQGNQDALEAMVIVRSLKDCSHR